MQVENLIDLKPAFLLFLVLHIRESELDEVKHMLARSAHEISESRTYPVVKAGGTGNYFPALFRHEVAERLFNKNIGSLQLSCGSRCT